jgi:hypothetical protein
MARSQWRSKRKYTGKKYKYFRKKRKRELSRSQINTEVGKELKKKQIVALEKVEIHPLLEGWHFYKFPRYIDGVLVGIAGLGVPYDESLVVDMQFNLD